MEKTFEEKFGLKTEEMENILAGLMVNPEDDVNVENLTCEAGCMIACKSCVGCTNDCTFCKGVVAFV